MPVYTNTIGAYQFIDIEGSVEGRQEEVTVERRDGVDGVAVIKHGESAKPIELVSVGDTGAFLDAQTALSAYRALVGTSIVLVQHSVSMGNFIVLDVRNDQPPRAQANKVGGLPGDSPWGVHHRVRWTLIAP